jgi:hypothetical protein
VGFASAPSKVPFYVAGGLLACRAVIVAATGIAHPDFPGSAGRARLVMLTGVVLVAATLAAAWSQAAARARSAGRSRPIGRRSADVGDAGARGRTDGATPL